MVAWVPVNCQITDPLGPRTRSPRPRAAPPHCTWHTRPPTRAAASAAGLGVHSLIGQSPPQSVLKAAKSECSSVESLADFCRSPCILPAAATRSPRSCGLLARARCSAHSCRETPRTPCPRHSRNTDLRRELTSGPPSRRTRRLYAQPHRTRHTAGPAAARCWTKMCILVGPCRRRFVSWIHAYPTRILHTPCTAHYPYMSLHTQAAWGGRVNSQLTGQLTASRNTSF